MSSLKFRIRCPNCETDTLLICLESSPIIYECNCCGRYVIAQERQLFSVKKDFFLKMVKKYDVKYCGQVVAHLENGNYQGVNSTSNDKVITENDIQKLRELLLKAKDVSDIIENI